VVCALGDLLLDVVVRLDGPIAADADTYGRTRVGPGGQAANVAAWVAALGGRARFLGKRARDPAGRLLADELRRRGVELAGPEVEAGTGTVVSIAASDGSRTMLTDRGVAVDFGPEELDLGWLTACECLHLPAYSLVPPRIRATALAAARAVAAAGCRVSVDLSSTSALAELGIERFRRLLAELRPELVFANEAESTLVGDLEAPTVVVKRGARGCAIRQGADVREHPAHPANVVDTTGAGDALAAGFLVAGPDLGLAAAARCVSQMGAMP
jgi:sugar/nucleoside kinase (ribokinase family)